MQQPHATRRYSTSGADRAQAVALTADEAEQRLTAGESALLLGAFLTLAASMASFVAL